MWPPRFYHPMRNAPEVGDVRLTAAKEVDLQCNCSFVLLNDEYVPWILYIYICISIYNIIICMYEYYIYICICIVYWVVWQILENHRPRMQSFLGSTFRCFLYWPRGIIPERRVITAAGNITGNDGKWWLVVIIWLMMVNSGLIVA